MVTFWMVDFGDHASRLSEMRIAESSATENDEELGWCGERGCRITIAQAWLLYPQNCSCHLEAVHVIPGSSVIVYRDNGS